MVPTNTLVRAIDGTQSKTIDHVTLNVGIAKMVLWVRFYVMLVGTMEDHMVLPSQLST